MADPDPDLADQEPLGPGRVGAYARDGGRAMSAPKKRARPREMLCLVVGAGDLFGPLAAPPVRADHEDVTLEKLAHQSLGLRSSRPSPRVLPRSGATRSER